MKKFGEKISNRQYLLSLLIIISLFPIASSTVTTYSTILYFKTDGIFKEMKHIDGNDINNIKHTYSLEDFDINNNIYKAEIQDSFFGDKVIIKLETEGTVDIGNFHIGFLVKIEDYFLENHNQELNIDTSIELDCDQDLLSVELDGTYTKEMKYCRNTIELNEIEITLIIPFNKYKNCFESCSECYNFGNETSHNCIKCKNSEKYYIKEDDNSTNCYTNSTIDIGYFLDEENNIYRKCSGRCLICSNSEEECKKCNNAQNYHFAPDNDNFCITIDELNNSNYYLDIDNDKYKRCNEKCLECSGPNVSDCILCNNNEGFYFKESNNNNICYSENEIEEGYYLDYDLKLFKKCNEKCLSCNKSEDNCIICNSSKGYYFKEDDNPLICISENDIEEGYYLDLNSNLIKKCNERCLSCNQTGNNSYSNCIRCINDEYHFDPIKMNHCIKQDELPNINYYLDEIDNMYKLCHHSCLNCSGPEENNCFLCNNACGFYYKEDETSLICHSKNDIEEGYYLDLNESLIKKCNEKCLSCNESGTDIYSNCIKCINNEYHFDPIIEKHCIKEEELPNINYYIDSDEDKFKLCHEACLNCSGPNSNECFFCNTSNKYYPKEDGNTSICYSESDIEEGYYLDLNESLIKKCNARCLSCNESGTDSYSNCIKCINNEYHFDPTIENHCIKEEELPNINYYVDVYDDKYKLCNETCLTCSGPNEDNCILCNNTKGYYFKEDDTIRICHSQNDIEIGYYLNLSNNLIKKCNGRCLSCNRTGTSSHSNCIECKNETYHFDPIKLDHCIQEHELPSTRYYVDINDNKYKICYERCLTCSGPNETECTSCLNSMGYYFKEDDTIPFCYSTNEIIEGYYLDLVNNLIKKCNSRCLSCNQGGTNSNSKCIKCNNEYHFDPTKSNHCIQENELPTVSYYLDVTTDKYKHCHQACYTCYGPNDNNCILCYNSNGYYYKEKNESQKCYSNSNIEIGYYLDNINNLFRRCNKRCLTCSIGGSDIESNCIKCNNSLNYHFDPIKPNHCLAYEELININYYLDTTFDKFKICYESCATCTGPSLCTTCNHTKGYYFIQHDNSGICYTLSTIAIGYYLNLTDNLFKLCHSRCYSCVVGGIDSETNCTKCNNNENYHFDPYKLNHCIKSNELPNTSYYLETSLDQYKICHESCLTCTGPYNNNCTSCNGKNFFETEFFYKRCLSLNEMPIDYYSITSSGKSTYHKCHISCRTCLKGGKYNCQTCNVSGGYYPVEEKPGYCLTEEETPIKYYLDRNKKEIKKCEANCATCTKGLDQITKEMNCDTCIPNTYFQSTTSTNCIPKPETKYYIDIYNDHETLFPCYPTCLTCIIGGNAETHNCLSCINEYYFDDEEPTNCVDDDLNCAIGCAKCYKNTTDPIYGVLSADKMCRRCSHKMGYYRLEKYSTDQFYVSCYPYNKSPLNYIYDASKKYHTLCYKTCKTCFKVGDSYNHSCTSCENNFIFIDEEPSNCFPKCDHYYYYNKYKQYKCTEIAECPLEYPYLIANKSKCVDNCYSDAEFNLMFKNECFQKCPEGTSSYIYRYNGEFTAKCINSDDLLSDKECDLDIKVSKLKYPEITEDILISYAEEYVHEYPVANSYVTSYLSPDSDTLNKYLIVIYKLEKCPKQKVEGFIPLGLDECIDKVKTKFTIMQNIVVQVFYIIRKSTPPQINYYLYHPDTGEKLDLSICSGAKLAIKTSIFDNGNVNEELVKYFSNLNINIFDIKDPFFTDICFNYDKDGKDVPLDDRIKLFYQNISLCEDGCSYVGINLNTYEVECSCDVKSAEENHINEDNIKNLLANPLSNEVFGVLTNSNIDVLKCIKYAFNMKLIFKNYGGLMMVGFIFIQIIATVFIKIQMKVVKRFIYTFINQIKNPPKRKSSLIKFQYEKRSSNNIINFDSDLVNKASKDNIINDIASKDTIEQNKKNEININNIKDKSNNINLKRNSSIKTNNTISRNRNYQLLKQGSLLSSSSLMITKDKYTIIKKGSNKNSTQYTNFITKEKDKKDQNNNSPNKSSSKVNINNSNISSGSSSGSNSGELGSKRIISGISDTHLNNLGNIIENKPKNRKSKKIFVKKIDDFGIPLDFDIIGTQKSPSRFKTHMNKIEHKNNIFENGQVIENGMSSGTYRDNIPINDLGYEDNKDIIIYSPKNKKKIISNIQEKNKKPTNNKINQDIKSLRRQIKNEIINQIKEQRKQKIENARINRLTMVPYDHKNYDEKELNELDYDEAVIYDKRHFCQMLWYTLKEKQTLINTFFAQNNLKPFSMKLLVLIFSFSCYFVINGFLYNEEYVSAKLSSEGNKTFYEYISDSIERILYTSIVGGIISFIIGIVFNTEKKIDNVLNKYSGNKILLKGEIAKIYRISTITMLTFIIIQYLLMILFTIYIFCFCYVYPNNKLDWFESSLIVIGIIQIFSLFTCFFFTAIKYIGIKFQLEFCFKINSYFDDKL